MTQIEDFFDYYWSNNRLSAFQSSEDVRFMDELPLKVQSEIFVDYLFVDFLYDYRSFFNPSKKSKIAEEIVRRKMQENKTTINFLQLDKCTWKLFAENKEGEHHKLFLVDFVKKLEPRYYNSQTGLIQNQYEEIFEVVFILRGTVAVGYSIFNEIFYGTQIIMTKAKKRVVPINDYSCIYNKVSEFLYKPIDYVEALSMRREHFDSLMNNPSNSSPNQIKKYIPIRYKQMI